ncbi:uncharacterized protein EV420DRAFT_1700980 [Desarmillaria tabescens]|uniref:Uncharacterized protein n=1 Tax=Armillaria tabescens TaxID=1929756 RepID=A0AA39MZN7_ARMTA|nr:uncharacterized protein EV420DRAFT_1700980 [Desarmillaria tabescens]KAK0452851.1 hypothetical protein EV420DRAFT_1700980 [Desarmillaria tabescens]
MCSSILGILIQPPLGRKYPDAREGMVGRGVPVWMMLALNGTLDAPYTPDDSTLESFISQNYDFSSKIFHLDTFESETPWAIRQISMHVILPISHAWISCEEPMGFWMPISGCEWHGVSASVDPELIPKDTSPGLIRIERLNMGAELRKDVCTGERKVEVLTIAIGSSAKPAPGTSVSWESSLSFRSLCREQRVPTKPLKKSCHVPYWPLSRESQKIVSTRPAVTMQSLDDGNGITNGDSIIAGNKTVFDIVYEPSTHVGEGYVGW